MNRVLLVLTLSGEGLLLHLSSGDLPYPEQVRVAAVAFAVAAAGIAAAPILRRHAPRREALALSELRSEDSVVLGRGDKWGAKEAEELLDRPQLRPGRRRLSLPVEALDRHVLILGTTGSGKTRMQELLLAQAVLRGDAVVVIDPKGDARLQRTIAMVCRAAGREPDLRVFSLPHPDRSVRYNPVGEFSDVREVADRIAALLPAQGEAQTFRSYAWEVVHTVARGLLAAGERVTLRGIRRHAIEDPWALVSRGIERHSRGGLKGPDGTRLARAYEKSVREGRLPGAPEIDALVALARRPQEHYQKMVAALVPVLGKLTASPLLEEGELSWDDVASGRVVYFHLGSLQGAETANAVAKMALLDLQSYVGRRYAESKEAVPLSLFVDEAADVVTGDFLHLLNKGRGAGIRVTMCAQTLADFEVALGTRARAAQVAGNVNTVIQFRARNGPDAETFSALAGERLLPTRSESERYEPALFGSGLSGVEDFRASFSKQRSWTRQPLVPPWAVIDLPAYCFFVQRPSGLALGRAPLLEIPS